MGKPVITTGNTHYSNKGFSLEAKNKKDYFSILKNANKIKPLTKKQVKLARQYAYSYFIQRQIPLNAQNKSQGHWGDLDLNKLDLLLPGRDQAMDAICDGIVKGQDVILNSKYENKKN